MANGWSHGTDIPCSVGVMFKYGAIVLAGGKLRDCKEARARCPMNEVDVGVGCVRCDNILYTSKCYQYCCGRTTGTETAGRCVCCGVAV